LNVAAKYGELDAGVKRTKASIPGNIFNKYPEKTCLQQPDNSGLRFHDDFGPKSARCQDS
jgi:hypothetical protein